MLWWIEFFYEYFWECVFLQMLIVFGVCINMYKLMCYYGLWDCYEFYDFVVDFDECNNFVGDFVMMIEIGYVDVCVFGVLNEVFELLFGMGVEDFEFKEFFCDLILWFDVQFVELGVVVELNWWLE